MSNFTLDLLYYIIQYMSIHSSVSLRENLHIYAHSIHYLSIYLPFYLYVFYFFICFIFLSFNFSLLCNVHQEVARSD